MPTFTYTWETTCWILILNFINKIFKVTVSTILSEFLNRYFSPRLEQMWVKIHLTQAKTPKSGFHEIFRRKCVSKQFVSGLLLIQVNQDTSASVWWTAYARNRFETVYAVYKLKLLQKWLIIWVLIDKLCSYR